MAKKKAIKQELDMAEHSSRLRAIPSNPWDYARRWFILVAAGLILIVLGWLVLGR